MTSVVFDRFCSYAEAVHQRIRRSELVVLENADHMLPITMADRFNAVALDFLRRVSGRG